MAFIPGGRADKDGNYYEDLWAVLQLTKLLNEELTSVIFEGAGGDEKGVDVWIRYKDGVREAHQCKARNASEEWWSAANLNGKNISRNSKYQLDRDKDIRFALVSAVPCITLYDLCNNARNMQHYKKEFCEYHTTEAGAKTKNFLITYCKGMGIDAEDKSNHEAIADYFARTYFYHYTENQLEEFIEANIKSLFYGEASPVKDALFAYLESGNTGKEISIHDISEYMKKKGFVFRNLVSDGATKYTVDTLNQQFMDSQELIGDRLLNQPQLKECIEWMLNGESLIIQGGAGSGKSGVSYGLAEYCEREGILYLALKMDRYHPKGSLYLYSKELGFKDSILQCLHGLSQDKPCLLLLDQIDALSGLQNYSNVMEGVVDICYELVRHLAEINKERKHNISLVIVCRKYDLENDSKLKKLRRQMNAEDIRARDVKLDELKEETVEEVLGEAFSRLSDQTIKLLRTPINLFIWTKLEEPGNSVGSTGELMEHWWKQIILKSRDKEHIREIIKEFVAAIEKRKKVSAKSRIFDGRNEALEYLKSSGVFNEVNGQVFFVHQSIYDYFLVKSMYDKYEAGMSIREIIGGRESQTLDRRYRLQMFLEDVAEHNIDEFVRDCSELLQDTGIRFYIKYMMLEVFGQITCITGSIKEFTKYYLKESSFRVHFIDKVVWGHIHYIELLIDSGYMAKRFNQGEAEKKEVFELLDSVTHDKSETRDQFIRTCIGKDEEDDKRLLECFENNLMKLTEEMFQLRLRMFAEYDVRIRFDGWYKELLQKMPERAADVFVFIAKNTEKIKRGHTEGFFLEYLIVGGSEVSSGDKELFIKMMDALGNIQIPDLPGQRGSYGTYYTKYALENMLVLVVLQICQGITAEEPEYIFDVLIPYIESGKRIYHEIILQTFMKVGERFRDEALHILKEHKAVLISYVANEHPLKYAEDLLKKYPDQEMRSFVQEAHIELDMDDDRYRFSELDSEEDIKGDEELLLDTYYEWLEDEEKTAWEGSDLEAVLNIAWNAIREEEDNYKSSQAYRRELKELEPDEIRSKGTVVYRAVRLMGILMWGDEDAENVFTDAIRYASESEHTVIKYASLTGLEYLCERKQTWAGRNALKIFKEDTRCVVYSGLFEFMELLYEEYPEEVIRIVKAGFIYKDYFVASNAAEFLIYISIDDADALSEIYDLTQGDDKKVKIIETVILRQFKSEGSKETGKMLLEEFLKREYEYDHNLYRLFQGNLLDLETDHDLVVKLVKSIYGERLAGDFLQFIKESDVSVADFYEEILDMAETSAAKYTIADAYARKYETNTDLMEVIIELYKAAESKIMKAEREEIQYKCLDTLDLMYAQRMGASGQLSKLLSETSGSL